MTISKPPARKRPTAAVARPSPGKAATAMLRPAQAAALPTAAKAPPSAAKEVAAMPGKHKLVRDRFSMPKPEYDGIAHLKQRMAGIGQRAKKSELLRAGLKALAALSDAALAMALAALPSTRKTSPSAKPLAAAVAPKADPKPVIRAKPTKA